MKEDLLQFYTAPQVAAMLGVKKDTVYTYIKRGFLKARRLYRKGDVRGAPTGHFRISKKDFDEFNAEIIYEPHKQLAPEKPNFNRRGARTKQSAPQLTYEKHGHLGIEKLVEMIK